MKQESEIASPEKTTPPEITQRHVEYLRGFAESVIGIRDAHQVATEIVANIGLLASGSYVLTDTRTHRSVSVEQISIGVEEVADMMSDLRQTAIMADPNTGETLNGLCDVMSGWLSGSPSSVDGSKP